MPDLKPISKEAITAALEKARHYRLLNQPWQAESICRDILQIDPNNQQALYTLILAITDQFESFHKSNFKIALENAEKLINNYDAEYSKGLIYERQGNAAFKRQTPRAGYIAYDYLVKAMKHYEEAEKIRPSTNEESILRWNACLRFISQNKLKPSPEETGRIMMLDV